MTSSQTLGAPLPLRAVRTVASLAALAALTLVGAPLHAQTQVANTVHNLTPGGPGQLKETRPTGLCVFCHTPHNANPAQALWNRDLPPVTYQLYSSSTLHAVLNQPTGSSRLCLSCHDGLVAMGNLRVAPPGEELKLGPITGEKNLGTDLSDDHPISFVYDGALAMSRGDLVDPTGLPKTVKLDATNQLQCTTCHDPHEDRRPKFLRMNDENGDLCLTCHRLPQWYGSSHATSIATWNGVGVEPWPPGSPLTVAANACRSCHHNHSAGHGPELMARAVETDNCTDCHNGSVATKSVAGEFTNPAKYSRHPVDVGMWTHEPLENPAAMLRHVTCADCHNGHAADSTKSLPPQVSGPLKGVRGVASNGSPLREATYEYEVCSKCHGFTEPNTLGITRVDSSRIVSRKIDPNNASYHPLAATGRNPTIRGLMPGYTATTMIGCVDCHNNNDWTPTGNAPRGTHASRYSPILEKEYLRADPTPESYANYEMCYKCHDRSAIINPTTLGFPHDAHVVQQQAPCAVCHDAHGSQQNAHLINFMVRDETGKSVVTPSSSGRLEYASTGPDRGSCYLQCHGADHNPAVYPR